MKTKSKKQMALDNRANQLNPNNEKYYKSRGYEKMKPKKKINIPEGTFRGDYFKVLDLSNSRLNKSFHFRFKISQDLSRNYHIWVLEAPKKEYAIDHPHDFHIFSNSKICWDRDITSFQDANAIMIVWAKRYVKQLEINKFGGNSNTLERYNKRFKIPQDTFRGSSSRKPQRRKNNKRRKTVTILQDVFDQIKSTIGTKIPETGGMLGCCNSFGIIDRYVFDEHARVSGVEYNPNTEFLETTFNDVWGEGTSLSGFGHSHPYDVPSPSCADVDYSTKIMIANDLRSLFMPIVMSTSYGVCQFKIFGYIINVLGRVERCNIEVISVEEYEKIVNGSIDDIEVDSEFTDSIDPITEEEIMSVFDSMQIKDDQIVPKDSTTIPNYGSTRNGDHEFSRVEHVLPLGYLSECYLIGIGCGGSRTYYLDMARLGIKHFYLMDGDKVTVTNIASQHAYKDEIGRSKVECIKEEILNINPKCEVEVFDTMLDDTITDSYLEEKILNRINKDKALLCGFTDSFFAQARINNISIKYNIPLIAGQHHQYGITSEIIYYYPGVSIYKPHDILSDRYDAYRNGYKNSITSEGSPIFNTTRINSLCEKISIGILLYKFDKSNLYASFLTKKPDCNLLIIRQSTLPISSNFYDLFEENTTSLSLFDDVVWLNPECEMSEMNIDDTRKIFP